MCQNVLNKNLDVASLEPDQLKSMHFKLSITAWVGDLNMALRENPVRYPVNHFVLLNAFFFISN